MKYMYATKQLTNKNEEIYKLYIVQQKRVTWPEVNICDHLSKNLTFSHKHAYWENRNLKIIHKIMHATKKTSQVLIGPVLNEGRLKSIKTI